MRAMKRGQWPGMGRYTQRQVFVWEDVRARHDPGLSGPRVHPPRVASSEPLPQADAHVRALLARQPGASYKPKRCAYKTR